MRRILAHSLMALILASSPTWGQNLNPLDIKSTSARLKALQLDVSIEDESNLIGIDKWGGNPAGIVVDEFNSKMVLFGQNNQQEQEQATNRINEDVNALGYFGVYNGGLYALQAEVAGQFSDLDLDISGFKDKHTTNQLTGNTAISRRVGPFLLGAEVSFLGESQDREDGITGILEDTEDITSDPVSYALGVGLDVPFETGRFTLGLSGDFVNEEEKDLDVASGFESILDEEGRTMGLQAILLKDDWVTLGLAYENEEVKRDLTQSSFKVNFNTEEKSYKFRTLIKPMRGPFQAGVEGTISETSFLVDLDGLPLFDLKVEGQQFDFGLAYVVAERGLLGFEVKTINLDTTNNFTSQKDKIETLNYVVGLEFPLLPFLSVRGSYQTGEQVDKPAVGNEVTTDIKTMGGGIGLRLGSRGKIDMGYTSTQTETDVSPLAESKDQSLSIVGTIYFSN